MKDKKVKWVVILLVVVLIVIVADIAVRFSVPAKPKQPSRGLIIPMNFAMETPDCMNELFKVANLTNIRIVPQGTLEARRLSQSKFYNSNFSER